MLSRPGDGAQKPLHFPCSIFVRSCPGNWLMNLSRLCGVGDLKFACQGQLVEMSCVQGQEDPTPTCSQACEVGFAPLVDAHGSVP